MHMKKFLEKIVHTVVPHEKNRNVPHLLRKEFVAVLFIFVVILFYFNENNFNIIRKLNLTATVYPAVLADLTNQDRTTAGVPKLAWNNSLQKSAELKAEDMIKNGYFAHTSPAGITPWFWLVKTNYNFIYAGENLAINFTESNDVEDAWLNSPKHRENIMNSHFSEIGITALDGFYQGRNTTFVVEFFGLPTETKIAEASTNTAISTPTTKIKTKITTVKPTVEGVSTESTEPVAPIKIIEQTDEPTNKFISAQNIDIVNAGTEGDSNLSQNKPLSTWYMRLIVSPTNTIKTIYTIILGLIATAMTLMFTKEYQKHHFKHLIMGAILIVLIVTSLYFSSIFLSSSSENFLVFFNCCLRNFLS